MSSRGTILISINTSWNIVNFRSSLVRALQAQGYRVVSASPPDAYTERLRTLVDQHIDLPMDNAGTSLRRDFRLACNYLRMLRTVKPDALLTYTIKPNIYGTLAARVAGVPVIANVSGLGTAFIRTNWLTQMVKLLYRFALRHAVCVFFQNSEDRDLFVSMKLVRPEKTALLPGSGIDLKYFLPVGTPRDAAVPVSFVLIARLLWDKGIGEFVEAARMVKASHPHIIFRLVGPIGVANKTAVPASAIEDWVREGVIEYLGETDHVRDIMAQHDCVVLPSYREGMSRVLLEAAAMGKPLIATDVPGCRQVVEHGVNGLLCKPYDAADLAARMLEFIACNTEQRTAMGQQSRAKAEREFDEQQVIDAYLTQLAQL